MLTVNEIFWAAQLGVLAYVVTCVLTQQNYILEWYYDLLIKLEARAKWLAYPLGYCEKCFGGQVALWVWVVCHWEEYLSGWFMALLRHGLFIAFTIIFVMSVKTFFKKWK